MSDSAVQLLARNAVETAREAVEDRIEEVTGRKARSRARRTRRILFALLAIAGLAALAVVVARRMQTTSEESEVAPDPFGTAVDEERRHDAFATPRA